MDTRPSLLTLLAVSRSSRVTHQDTVDSLGVESLHTREVGLPISATIINIVLVPVAVLVSVLVLRASAASPPIVVPLTPVIVGSGR